MDNLSRVNQLFDNRSKSKNFILSKELINEVMRINWKYGISLTPKSISKKVGISYSVVLQIFAGENYEKIDYDKVTNYLHSLCV